MEIEFDNIISPEPYNGYGSDHRQNVSAKRVKGFMDRGLMTKSEVLSRFTEILISTILIGRDEGEVELSNIKENFRQLCDPQTGYVSKERFSHVIFDRSQAPFARRSDAITTLLGIIAWHASFPFPLSTSSTIDQDGLIRAICLLTLNPSPRFNSRFYGVSTGQWGPHAGSRVQTRGKCQQDLRRRFSRSLAVSAATTDNAAEGSHKPTNLPVARFFMYQPREKQATDAPTQENDSDDFEDLGQQVLVTMAEDERCIDLQDVLSECPPEEDRLTLNPLRESYETVLSTLPQQPLCLHEMEIPRSNLASLFNILNASNVNGGNGHEQDLLSVSDYTNSSSVSWQEFDSILSKNQQQFVQALSTVLSIFKSPVDMYL